jgi:RNA polymerase sigma factor (sigma-70 family)
MGANDFDTHIGGDKRDLPSTTWTLVSRVRSGQGLAELCQRFWKPVYHYIRVAWRKSNEDAKDLTQAFFCWVIEGDALAKYEPGRGGFRPYLKLVLKHFIANHEEALSRIKRGGGITLVPITDDAVPPDTDDPEKALDRAWLGAILERAMDRTKRKFADRPVQWMAFDLYELGTEKLTYQQVADRLGIKETDVRNHLFAVREEMRAEIVGELSDTTEGDPESEYRELFG